MLQGEIFEERIFTDTINDYKTKFLEDARQTVYSQRSEQYVTTASKVQYEEYRNSFQSKHNRVAAPFPLLSIMISKQVIVAFFILFDSFLFGICFVLILKIVQTPCKTFNTGHMITLKVKIALLH